MNLDVSEMLNGTPVQMRYVHRWSTSRTLVRENVAEHSWFVCFYALMVARYAWHHNEVLSPPLDDEAEHHLVTKYGPNGRHAFIGDVLQRAVLHDMEEARSGDIHRPFKHSTPELKQMLDKASYVAFRQAVAPMLCQNSPEIDLLQRNWKDAKSPDSVEGRIVDFADFLSVISYCREEGPEVTRTLCLETLPDHWDDFRKNERFKFIGPLIGQVDVLVREVLNNVT